MQVSVEVPSAHGAPACPRIPAYLDGFGVNAEHGLSTVNGLGYPLADGFPKGTCEFPAADKIDNGVGAFLLQPVEETILTVNTEGLDREGKCNGFNIGKYRDYTATRDVSLFIYPTFKNRSAILGVGLTLPMKSL